MKIKLALLYLLLLPSFARSQNVDINLLAKLNPSSTSADRVFKFVSDKAIITTTAAPFALYLAGTLAHDPELKKNALQTGIALAGTTAMTFALKNSIERMRPFVAYPDKIAYKGGGSGYSFPSGHTSSTFALATTLSLNYPKWYVIAPSFALAATTAYSRMYMGVHYPSDVAGGIILGAGSAYLTWKLQKVFDKGYKKKRIYSD
ncbi:phosphatase PAP2 family protein [Olivibacter ginsenosidimutans]|uniref:Phosphatase PAP2 family protein n=1 Tax=Olivibacter ginsenosidimutans TaxID=1176537 RepID=A0ABP9BG13_9SPHI